MALPGFNASSAAYQSSIHYVGSSAWSGTRRIAIDGYPPPGPVGGSFGPSFAVQALGPFSPIDTQTICGPCNAQCQKICGPALYGTDYMLPIGQHIESCCTGGACNSGACVCAPFLSLCNGACVDLDGDRVNCGACGHSCPSGQYCREGVCGTTACNTAAVGKCRSNADQAYAQCLAACPQGGPFSATCLEACNNEYTDAYIACGYTPSACLAGTTCCYGECKRLAVDPNNCGACGARCSAPNQICCNRTCIDPSADKANCGSCNHACSAPANADPACVAGVCDFTCKTGFTRCGNSCVDLTSDSQHCGSCETNCGTGVCCNRTCVDLTSNSQHCGSCIHACSAPANADPVCAAGVCDFTCKPGFTRCGNSCVDLTSNSQHCGSCIHACSAPANADPACAAGVCDITCKTGFTRCGNSCVDLTSNSQHCGSCIHACSAPANANPACAAGVCDFTCKTGFTKTGNSCCPNGQACNGQCCSAGQICCNGRCLDPNDLKTDFNNCGVCGHQCRSPQTCENGVCVLPPNCRMTCASAGSCCAGDTASRCICYATAQETAFDWAMACDGAPGGNWCVCCSR